MKNNDEVDDALEGYKRSILLNAAFNEGYRLGCRAAQQINN